MPSVSSALPEAIRLPSGLKAMLVTVSRWPRSVQMFLPLSASHRLIVPPQSPEAIALPSGRNASAVTALSPAGSLSNSLPLAASQTLSV